MANKLFITLILFLTILKVSQAQNKEVVKFKRNFIAFEGCQNTENLKVCFEKKFQDFILKTIKKNDIEKLIQSKKKDTLTFYSYLFFNKKGKLINSKSILRSEDPEEKISLQYILKNLPNIHPPLDQYNNIVSIAINNTFGFKINRTSKTISPIDNYESTEIPYNVIEKVPIYDGCNEELTNDDLRKCISNKISELFSNNFDLNVLYNSNLPNGLVRIYLQFKVNKEGEVKDIKTNMTKRKIKKETIRIIKLIPKFKSPGIHKGKPVIVPFSLPILFNLEK